MKIYWVLFLCLFYVNFIYSTGIFFLSFITLMKLIVIYNKKRHCTDELDEIKLQYTLRRMIPYEWVRRHFRTSILFKVIYSFYVILAKIPIEF